MTVTAVTRVATDSNAWPGAYPYIHMRSRHSCSQPAYTCAIGGGHHASNLGRS